MGDRAPTFRYVYFRVVKAVWWGFCIFPRAGAYGHLSETGFLLGQKAQIWVSRLTAYQKTSGLRWNRWDIICGNL